MKDGSITYRGMKELKNEKMNKPVKIGKVEIKPIEWLIKPEDITLQPMNFKLEGTTVWSFPKGENGQFILLIIEATGPPKW
mgnify:CR=1 FL=1